MPRMVWTPDKKWLALGVIFVAIFIDAISMHLDKPRGLGFVILCFLVVSVGVLAVVWAKQRSLLHWNQSSKRTRAILVASVIAIALVAIFLTNRHKPDEEFDDVLGCLGILFVLGLLALKRAFSRLMDALHARLTRR
jgi:peptidoglycan/LPS O-acetylase OafA/YrhL